MWYSRSTWPAGRWSVVAMVASAIVVLLGGVAAGSVPAAGEGGHDATRPRVMKWVTDRVRTARVGGLAPRRPTTQLNARVSADVSSGLRREVLGLATPAGLGDPSVGHSSWDFSLLSEVVFWGLNVNPDGSLVQDDTAWTVWHSDTASGLLEQVHHNGPLTSGIITITITESAAGPLSHFLAARRREPVDYQGPNPFTGLATRYPRAWASLDALTEAFAEGGRQPLRLPAAPMPELPTGDEITTASSSLTTTAPRCSARSTHDSTSTCSTYSAMPLAQNSSCAPRR